MYYDVKTENQFICTTLTVFKFVVQVVPSATLSLLGDMVEVHGSQKEQEHGVEQAISN